MQRIIDQLFREEKCRFCIMSGSLKCSEQTVQDELPIYVGACSCVCDLISKVIGQVLSSAVKFSGSAKSNFLWCNKEDEKRLCKCGGEKRMMYDPNKSKL